MIKLIDWVMDHLPIWVVRKCYALRHPIATFRRARHAREYPRLNSVIYYHGILVQVVETTENGDDLRVVWYDEDERHEEWASWLHCCERV